MCGNVPSFVADSWTVLSFLAGDISGERSAFSAGIMWGAYRKTHARIESASTN
jgi:hypothetical protein